jgi:hypothetical protein
LLEDHFAFAQIGHCVAWNHGREKALWEKAFWIECGLGYFPRHGWLLVPSDLHSELLQSMLNVGVLRLMQPTDSPHEQKDGNGNTQQPQKSCASHLGLLCSVCFLTRERRRSSEQWCAGRPSPRSASLAGERQALACRDPIDSGRVVPRPLELWPPATSGPHQQRDYLGLRGR